MKISTYYKMQGDNVTFFKGNLRELALNDTYEALLKQLYSNNEDIFWEKYKPQIYDYLKKGTQSSFDEIPLVNENPIIKELLEYYKKYFRKQDYFKSENRKWDRVVITTLFTFYWNITIET